MCRIKLKDLALHLSTVKIPREARRRLRAGSPVNSSREAGAAGPEVASSLVPAQRPEEQGGRLPGGRKPALRGLSRTLPSLSLWTACLGPGPMLACPAGSPSGGGAGLPRPAGPCRQAPGRQSRAARLRAPAAPQRPWMLVAREAIGSLLAFWWVPSTEGLAGLQVGGWHQSGV